MNKLGQNELNKNDFSTFFENVENRRTSTLKRQKLIKMNAFRPWGCYRMILLSWEILISWLKADFVLSRKVQCMSF